jgi:tetratricopeptide (TPR) repeat protein
MLARIASANGEHEQALRNFERSLELDPASAITWRWKAATLLALGRRDEARASYERALALRGDDVIAIAGLAELELDAGRSSEARRLADRAVEVAPHSSLGYYWLGRVAFAAQDFAGAARSFADALARASGDFNAAYSLGRALEAQGLSEEATGAFERALTMQIATGQRPFARDAYRRVAASLAARGATDEALRKLDEALARFPGDGELESLRDALARAH